MPQRKLQKVPSLVFAAILLLRALWPASAQEHQTSYPNMAPLEQYMITDREAEIALARSAAPATISRDAKVLILGRQGYETASEGRNGFICLVERSWMSPFDSPEFWNPKIRGPICYNPPAARSILPFTFRRTAMVFAGMSKPQMIVSIQKASEKKELLQPEVGAMSYMMSKHGYLNDSVGSWLPHLMFHLPKTDGATWGANVAGSPVLLNEDYHEVPEPETIFMVPVCKWSDGTPAPER
jgi:hypothetical protein